MFSFDAPVLHAYSWFQSAASPRVGINPKHRTFKGPLFSRKKGQLNFDLDQVTNEDSSDDGFILDEYYILIWKGPCRGMKCFLHLSLDSPDPWSLLCRSQFVGVLQTTIEFNITETVSFLEPASSGRLRNCRLWHFNVGFLSHEAGFAAWFLIVFGRRRSSEDCQALETQTVLVSWTDWLLVLVFSWDL